MPGTVRYEVDLAKLKPSDLDWDAATNALTVTLPPLRLAGPEIDIDPIIEFRARATLLTLTDADQVLAAANHNAAQQEPIKPDTGPTPLRPPHAPAAPHTAPRFP